MITIGLLLTAWALLGTGCAVVMGRAVKAADTHCTDDTACVARGVIVRLEAELARASVEQSPTAQA